MTKGIWRERISFLFFSRHIKNIFLGTLMVVINTLQYAKIFHWYFPIFHQFKEELPKLTYILHLKMKMQWPLSISINLSMLLRQYRYSWDSVWEKFYARKCHFWSTITGHHYPLPKSWIRTWTTIDLEGIGAPGFQWVNVSMGISESAIVHYFKNYL